MQSLKHLLLGFERSGKITCPIILFGSNGYFKVREIAAL